MYILGLLFCAKAIGQILWTEQIAHGDVFAHLFAAGISMGVIFVLDIIYFVYFPLQADIFIDASDRTPLDKQNYMDMLNYKYN